MKSGKMPTTTVLLFFSWLIVFLGCLAGAAVLVMYGVNNVKPIVGCILIVLGSLFISVLVRMIANIGQMLFDMNSFICVVLFPVIKDANGSLQEIKTFFSSVAGHLDMDKNRA